MASTMTYQSQQYTDNTVVLLLKEQQVIERAARASYVGSQRHSNGESSFYDGDEIKGVPVC